MVLSEESRMIEGKDLDFGVCVSGFFIRPTVVQTGPFWYLSVGSITCPSQ